MQIAQPARGVAPQLAAVLVDGVTGQGRARGSPAPLPATPCRASGALANAFLTSSISVSTPNMSTWPTACAFGVLLGGAHRLQGRHQGGAVGPRRSMAPERISFSITRLLSFLMSTRLQKSNRSRKGRPDPAPPGSPRWGPRPPLHRADAVDDMAVPLTLKR